MKKLPHLFAAAALIGGVAGLAATPAFAKDKKEEQKGGLALSKEMRDQVVAADAQIQARNLAAAEPLVAQIEQTAKTDDDRYMAAALRLNIAKLQLSSGGSENALIAPIDTLLANPKTPPADIGTYAYQRAALAFNAKDYKGALSYLARAKQAGSTDPNIPLLEAKAKLAGGDTAGGSAALQSSMEATLAAGGKPDEQMYRYAIAQNAKTTNGGQAALPWVQKYLAAYPTKKNWRDMTVAWGIQGSSMTPLEKAQKVDLFRLLRAGNALADQYDYETYAHWAIDLGLPYEAKAVVAEGQAAGKIPTGSAEAKSIVTAANTAIANDGSLASLEKRARSGSAKLAMATADGFLGSDQYATAADLYRVAMQKGGIDMNAANLRLGIALARSGDKEGARTAFAAVKAWPYAGVGQLWTTYLDHPPVA